MLLQRHPVPQECPLANLYSRKGASKLYNQRPNSLSTDMLVTQQRHGLNDSQRSDLSSRSYDQQFPQKSEEVPKLFKALLYLKHKKKRRRDVKGKEISTKKKQKRKKNNVKKEKKKHSSGSH